MRPVIQPVLLASLVAASAPALAACDREAAAGEVRSESHAAAAPAPPAPVSALAPPSASSAAPTASAKPAATTDGVLTMATDAGNIPAARASRVLHIGDSMVPLVGNYLRQLFRGDRHYHIVSETSSSTLSWDNDRKLQRAMYKYDPEVVLISLGSNELFDPKPERRAGAIRRLVADTRGRPCLWIGPPAWKKDKGFIRVLKANLGHCRYFDSTALELERMADGRHPSWSASYRWAAAVWKVMGGTEDVPTGNARPK